MFGSSTEGAEGRKKAPSNLFTETDLYTLKLQSEKKIRNRRDFIKPGEQVLDHIQENQEESRSTKENTSFYVLSSA